MYCIPQTNVVHITIPYQLLINLNPYQKNGLVFARYCENRFGTVNNNSIDVYLDIK